MKVFIGVLFLAGCFLCSCSTSPADAAKGFAENMAKGKIEEAKKHATEATGNMLDVASGMGTLSIQPDFKFEKIRDSVTENRAWVTFRDGTKEETLELVKIDGKWLVHINPNSMQ